MRKIIFSFILVASAGAVVLLNACAPQRNLLEQVQDSGELRILTRNGPTTYYIGPNGPTGPEYELVQAFAQYLGVKVKLVVEDNLEHMLRKIEAGDAHIAAAGLTITDARKQRMRFTPPYQTVTEQVVYRRGNKRPRSIKALESTHLEVLANSSHAERLAKLKKSYPKLSWDENSEIGSSELLTLVSEQMIDYTIADSNEVALVRRYHPDVRVAFDLSLPESLAWAMPKNKDDSLYQAATTFFNTIKENGKLKRLLAKHYGHVRRYDYAGTPTYMRHITQRLPSYRKLFTEASEAQHMDWRLLAAVAYQESLWNPRAVSPTGVRGIMMLTRVTAKQMGVAQRTDAAQSIDGGARYLRNLFDKFAYLPEPDRTWLALAAYNVGYGHVRDAQKITRKRGGDPTKWTDVKDSLPLLQRRKWYRKTRYGYARGGEPVRYVENIRSYYDILRWYNDRDDPYKNKSVVAFTSPVL